ncbi:MAG: hypothetical protein EOP48_26955 [Sphingobacteriales bacterium]|nr:MAG: hypothetical protein EOP48_26955 [Sphingobacteriales bacterium]
MKLVMLILLIAYLTSCASSFQPHQGSFGYNVFSSGDGRYRIEYFDKDIGAAKQYWNNAAKLACSGDYTTRYTAERAVENGSYLVPIAGTNQSFNYYLHIYEGEVTCNKLASPSLSLASSPWFFYGKQKNPIPVSKSYLTRRFGFDYGLLSKAEKITPKTSPSELTQLMGPAAKYSELEGNSEWLFGGGYKKLVVVRIGNCITKVKLAGDPLSLLAEIQEKRRKADDPELFGTYISPDFYYLLLGDGC